MDGPEGTDGLVGMPGPKERSGAKVPAREGRPDPRVVSNDKGLFVTVDEWEADRPVYDPRPEGAGGRLVPVRHSVRSPVVFWRSRRGDTGEERHSWHPPTHPSAVREPNQTPDYPTPTPD